MAYLMKTTTQFLGTESDFKRESHLEGFIVSNPNILSSTEDAPEDYNPVYIIGRQFSVDIIDRPPKNEPRITDLVCLIWDPDVEKYEIWIYELKTYSQSAKDVEQLVMYLEKIDAPENKKRREKLIKDAQEFIDEMPLADKIRGALLAQAFKDEVIKKIIEENKKRRNEDKLLAVKITRFPIDNDVYVMVDQIVGIERTPTGGRKTFYEDIPNFTEKELKDKLKEILTSRKNTHPTRFKQLMVLLKLLAENPDAIITQESLRETWAGKGLPRKDEGQSVSQPLGYKNNGALRQILKWDTGPLDIKDNYRLRDKKYAEVIKSVLAELELN